MNDQRILIHVKNGNVHSVLIEDENQTIALGAENAPEIIVMDEDDQADEPVYLPPVDVKPVTTKDFDQYKLDVCSSYPDTEILEKIEKVYEDTRRKWAWGGGTEQTSVTAAAAEIREKFSEHSDLVEIFINRLDNYYIK